MVKVSYQVIFNEVNFRIEDFKKLLKSILEETCEDVYNEFIENDLLENIIKIKYYHKINEDKYIIGFDIDFSIFIPENPEKYGIRDKDEYIKKIIKNFNKNLLDNENIETAFKFYDENLLNQLKKLYNEIFEIEMKLREALTFIFATILNIESYDLSILGKDCYGFLRHQTLNPTGIPSKKNLTRNKRFKECLENEFFYLTFSQYQNLKIPDFVKINDLLEILFNGTEDDILYKIYNMPVIKYRDKYDEFLRNIREYLESIEKIRNCVAHNRTITDEELKNYNEIIGKLKEELDSFFKPKVIFATIYVEEIMPNVYRQNSTKLHIMVFGGEEEDEIDFGDEMIHGDDIYDVGDDFKELLLKYLEENGYNIDYLDKSNIEIEHI